MKPRTLAAAVAIAAAAVAACTNGGGLSSIGGGGGGGPTPTPVPGSIGVALPQSKIGVENDPTWGIVGGYTQMQTSQVMAFPPGITVTIQNIDTQPHTLSVAAVGGTPPPNWPQNPSLSFYPQGNGVLGAGYSSGTLQGGAKVKVKLTKPGVYLIGCAFHYLSNTMRDVIQVSASATPGPTASPGSFTVRPPAQQASVPAHKAAAPARRSAQPYLVDQNGRRFTLSSLRGEPVIITFIAAHCTDACPLINGQFAQVADAMQRSHLHARLLTITLDPEHDSIKTMQTLARRFHADSRYWLVAGGTVADVQAIMRAFGVVSIEGKHGYHDEHSTFVYAFDSQGSLAQTMLASTALNDDLVAALRSGRWVKHS